MKIVQIAGFLGSGKTTLLLKLSRPAPREAVRPCRGDRSVV